jgi:hypothetical protein
LYFDFFDSYLDLLCPLIDSYSYPDLLTSPHVVVPHFALPGNNFPTDWIFGYDDDCDASLYSLNFSDRYYYDDLYLYGAENVAKKKISIENWI